MTAVAVLHKEEILKRVAKGDKIADIGKTYKVSHAAISKQLSNDPEWKEARMSGASKDRTMGKVHRRHQPTRRYGREALGSPDPDSKG